MSDRRGNLVDQRDALSVYFEALLRESAEEIKATRPVDVAPPIEKVAEKRPQIPARQATAEPRTATIPEWGEQTFQAMLFKVAGLTLAVPLAELNGIQEWEGTHVTQVPGHARWSLGLTKYRGRSVQVVDTAAIVLPEDRLMKVSTRPQDRIQRVVFIGEGTWGLGCDEVSEVVTLAPEQVRWRTERTKRRWLAGTVIEHMCALIEPSVLAELLDEGMDEAGRGPGATGSG